MGLVDEIGRPFSRIVYNLIKLISVYKGKQTEID